MRDTRVLYVEDDPALRAIMTSLLSRAEKLSIANAVGSEEEALQLSEQNHYDVALIDLALGTKSSTGLELAFALRRKFPDLGIVIFSQHANADFMSRLPKESLWSWSTVQKTADVNISYLADVLRSTARGLSILDPKIIQAARTVSHKISELTPRQREIMGLLTTGLDGNAIASKMNLAPVTIRKELSRVYKLYVPNPIEGTDLRTSAIMSYMRDTRGYAWASDE